MGVIASDAGITVIRCHLQLTPGRRVKIIVLLLMKSLLKIVNIEGHNKITDV